MKTLITCALFLITSGALKPQNIGPASLRSLNFLQGIWTLNNTVETNENLEFHWSTRQGTPVLIGRRWSGNEMACPWCVAQSAMIAKYDTTLNQVRLHFVDRDQRVRNFHLTSVEKNSAVFSTEERLGLPTHKLTFTHKGDDTLQLTLAARSDWDGHFRTLLQATFHRR